MSPIPATPTFIEQERARLDTLVTDGQARLRGLLTAFGVVPNLLDRTLLGELAAFLDHDAWVAVDAAEQLRSVQLAHQGAAVVSPERTAA